MDLEVLLSRLYSSILVDPASSGIEWDRCFHHAHFSDGGMRGCKLIDVMINLVAFLASINIIYLSRWQLKHLH